jgi:chromosome segregation ATPase
MELKRAAQWTMATALALGMLVPFAGPVSAYADEHEHHSSEHAKASVHSTLMGNFEGSENGKVDVKRQDTEVNVDRQDADTHDAAAALQKIVKQLQDQVGDKSAKLQDRTEHQQLINKLQDAIAQYKKDRATAQQLHKQLMADTRELASLLEQALEKGDTDAINQALNSLPGIIQQLNQAVQAQEESDNNAQTAVNEGKVKGVQRAIQAIQAADAREKAKIAKMQAADQALKSLIAEIQKSLASADNGSTTVNGSESGNVSAGNNTAAPKANVTVTVGN